MQYWTRIENIVHWSQVQYFIISKYYNYMTLVWHISRLSNIKDVKCTNKCTQTCKSTKNRYITWHTDIQFLPECLINTVFDVMWDVKKRERCIKKVLEMKTEHKVHTQKNIIPEMYIYLISWHILTFTK